jgi:hypothetical protein
MSVHGCSPKIAFVLAGAYYTQGNHGAIRSFAEMVEGPMGQNNQSVTFVNVLLRRHRHTPWHEVPGEAQVEAFREELSLIRRLATVAIAVSSVAAVDDESKLPGGRAAQASFCIFGCRDQVGAQMSGYCREHRPKMVSWWGKMAAAWDMIDAWEQLHRLTFDSVFFARADIRYLQPLRPPCFYNHRDRWHTAVIPPDALWYMGRELASNALQTMRKIAPEGGVRCRKGASRLPSRWKLSFFTLCYWANELFGRGLRLQVMDVNASVQLKGSTVLMTTPSIVGRFLPGRPSAGDWACSWRLKELGRLLVPRAAPRGGPP